jgi:hypothetical protein
MFSLKRIRDDFVRTRKGLPKTPSPEALRELCITLLADIAPLQRESLMDRLPRMRRADDLWNLRSALFDLISLTHGETVARERLAALDAGLAAMPRDATRARRSVWSATVS